MTHSQFIFLDKRKWKCFLMEDVVTQKPLKYVNEFICAMGYWHCITAFVLRFHQTGIPISRVLLWFSIHNINWKYARSTSFVCLLKTSLFVNIIWQKRRLFLGNTFVNLLTGKNINHVYYYICIFFDFVIIIFHLMIWFSDFMILRYYNMIFYSIIILIIWFLFLF